MNHRIRALLTSQSKSTIIIDCIADRLKSKELKRINCQEIGDDNETKRKEEKLTKTIRNEREGR